MELVAPAGTPEKLKTALHFGADAVYLGMKKFSMRAYAGNFDADQLEWALDYAHERGRKVYVTVNILPDEEDLDGIDELLRLLARLRPDGIIVGDPGVFDSAKKLASGIPVHLSTQLSTTTSRAANFWFSRGISRIVLARELSLDQLTRIVASSNGPLEVFAHGAVCIAYSGRCLLSLYWAGRDARKGACAQGCRWPYKALLVDGRHPDRPAPVVEDDRGTHFFDAADLCSLPVLDRLVATGVSALKIEGRTRSQHYLGIVTDVYRQALDQLKDGDLVGFKAVLDERLAELRRPVFRGHSTHFLTGDQDRYEVYNPEGSALSGRNDFLGKVVAVSSSHIDIDVRFPFHPGQPAELRDAGKKVIPLTVEQVTAVDGTVLDFARPGIIVRIAGSYAVSPGTLFRTGEESP
jgi:U32 family peptidase